MMSERSEPNQWFVYILRCKDQSLYTGITNNLQRRLNEHRQGKGGYYTNSFKALDIVYQEEQPTKQEALKREAQIKGWTRNKKLALIKGDKAR
jgi:putative endonuclease